MKIIPFDVEKAKSGKYKIQTKGGDPARIICWDKKDSTYNLVALITFKEGIESVISLTKTGVCCNYSPSMLDLVLVDESTPSIRQQIYDTIIQTYQSYPEISGAIHLSASLLADFIQEGLNLPKWKFIRKGEILPKTSILKGKDGTLYCVPYEKGEKVSDDYWYLPIIELEKLDYEI